MPFTLPAGVRGMAARGAAWADWVDTLPGTTTELLAEWDLRLDGIPMHGYVGLVLPVRDRDGRTAILKISFPDEETAHEHLALRRWGGRGAVALLRADPRRRALLLDRLGSRKLTEVDVDDACEQVALRYADLHVPAPPQLRRLSEVCARWGTALAALPRGAALPHRLVQQAVSLARDLAADPETDGVLVHGDLHGDNVLEAPPGSAYAGDWVVIDPKPLSGDPHLEPAPMLWNRWDEAVATGDVRDAVRRRFFTLVDTAGLDEDRARAWVVLRLVVLGLQQLEEPTPDTAELVTRAVTVAKAVQGDD
jgi:streptomycin 6-kinase